MKFTIQAPEASYGIRVIEEIPDQPLCGIEGRNGIGKTLAIHLLEICTGQQPYDSRSDAWQTLCEYLGPATITIEGLRGPEGDDEGHDLRFAFDWRDRTHDPLPIEITRGLFDEVTLDGKDVPEMEDVRRWLQVVRIAGDESLTDTIAGLVSHDRELLRSAVRVAADRARYVDALFDALLRPFPREPADGALAASEALRELAASRTDLASDRDRQHAAVVRLEAAHAAQVDVEHVAADADTLDAEITSLKAQLEEATARREEAEKELTEARDKRRLGKEAASELASAQRTFTRRLNALERADAAIAKAAADLDVRNEAQAVAAALEAVAVDRRALAGERADLSDAFALRDLLDSLVHALAPAAAGGLRARTVATVDGRSLTAGDLLDAVRTRRERLTADAPAVEELDRRLAELDARERALESLRDALADRVEKREKLDEAEEALNKLTRADHPSDDLVAEKAAAQAAAQRVEIEIGSALGAAERQRAQLGGGLSLEDLRAERDRRLGEAGTTAEALEDELRKARALRTALDDRLNAADVRRDELVANLADHERALAEQTHRLAADDAHARLRDILGNRAPRVTDDGEDQARAWLAIHAAQDRAVQRVQGVRGGLGSVVERMSDLVDVIRNKTDASPELDAIRRVYQGRLEERFRQEEIVDALFDGGTLTRVDLAARQISWKTKDNESRVRPFEAFSSGERAFAYVQARLGTMSQLTSLNRVVAVDEFGAFLSRDRLIRLQQVIERQLTDGIIEQALIVLPLGAVSQVEEGDEAPQLITGPFDVLAHA